MASEVDGTAWGTFKETTVGWCLGGF